MIWTLPWPWAFPSVAPETQAYQVEIAHVVAFLAFKADEQIYNPRVFARHIIYASQNGGASNMRVDRY
jgi:hypothetical protein